MDRKVADRSEMLPEPTIEAVLDALTVLRTTLEADNYRLNVTVASSRIELVVAADEACAACLVPRGLMESMITDMLASGGIDAPFDLRYPSGHFDA